MTNLQKVSRYTNWFRYFRLQNIFVSYGEFKNILSERSFELIKAINSLIDELREQVKIDYINYRTRVLIKRTLHEQAIKDIEKAIFYKTKGDN